RNPRLAGGARQAADGAAERGKDGGFPARSTSLPVRARAAKRTQPLEEKAMTTTLTEKQLQQAHEISNAMQTQIARAVVGQKDAVDQVLAALFAGGHVLIEGVPGLGKTLLVRALAKTFGGSYARIQFTPDLMPADVTGHTIYDPRAGAFTTRRGPVFTQLLLADEINRAPAKTQAALLEVMQEGQVTIEGMSHAL